MENVLCYRKPGRVRLLGRVHKISRSVHCFREFICWFVCYHDRITFTQRMRGNFIIQELHLNFSKIKPFAFCEGSKCLQRESEANIYVLQVFFRKTISWQPLITSYIAKATVYLHESLWFVFGSSATLSTILQNANSAELYYWHDAIPVQRRPSDSLTDFSGVFLKLRKATICFIMSMCSSICLSVCLIAWDSCAPTKRIFFKIDI